MVLKNEVMLKEEYLEKQVTRNLQLIQQYNPYLLKKVRVRNIFGMDNINNLLKEYFLYETFLMNDNYIDELKKVNNYIELKSLILKMTQKNSSSERAT